MFMDLPGKPVEGIS